MLACGGVAANLQIFASSVCAGSFFTATPDSSTLHLECRCADAAHANYLCVSWVCVACFSCLPALIPQELPANPVPLACPLLCSGKPALSM